MDRNEKKKKKTSQIKAKNFLSSIKSCESVGNAKQTIFSSPVQSTGRAIVVTLASALALALTLPLPLALPFPSRHF